MIFILGDDGHGNPCSILAMMQPKDTYELEMWLIENNLESKVRRYWDGEIYSIELTHEDFLSFSLRFK